MNDKELFDLVRKNYAEANKDYLRKQSKAACAYCQNNPKNGGNVICNCILGSPKIT